MKYISILGSTGSIGKQALDVIGANPERFRVSALAALQNDVLLEEQIDRFKPRIAVLADKNAADRLVRRYRGSTQILSGEDGLIEAAVCPEAAIVLTSLVGFAGLRPTLAAITAGKNIALANKETLVAAGEIVTALAVKHNVSIIPVDSEHSAIFQCLQGERIRCISRLILTASGGPFRGRKKADLADITVEECLKHPNWSMGKKITVDSATLANKGLEVIEAKWLFDVPYDKIEVVVHPQSIIHSMVEFTDTAIMAQMGLPDMRVPIQYALTYPERIRAEFPKLDFISVGSLTFESPDMETFPMLKLAYQAGRKGGIYPCIFNAANEIAVHSFLNHDIAFTDIPTTVQAVMEESSDKGRLALEDLLAGDAWARQRATEIIRTMKN